MAEARKRPAIFLTEFYPLADAYIHRTHAAAMFKSLENDYFLLIECPGLKADGKCRVINCIFKHGLDGPSKKRSLCDDLQPLPLKYHQKSACHESSESQGSAETREFIDASPTVDSNSDSVDHSSHDQEYKLSPAIDSSIQSVLDDSPQAEDDEEAYRILPRLINHMIIPEEQRCLNIQKIYEYYLDQESTKDENDAIIEEHSIACKSHDEKQYSLNVQAFLKGQEVVEITDPRTIMPRPLSNRAPAPLPERKRYIELLVSAHKLNNAQSRIPISKSIAEEYEVASSTSPSTYVQAIKKKIYYARYPAKLKIFVKKGPTPEEYFSKLQDLVISKDKLKMFGYIVDLPASVEPNPSRTCARCGARFELYGDSLPLPVGCKYHAGRLRRKNKLTRAYDCCGADEGSDTDPCLTCEHHVFYWENAEERHAALPYQNTKDLFDASSYVLSKCLGIDCEMGFTTRGFELLRISAIEFLTGKDVLDVLVRPKGTVIDLNTRYSGVARIEPTAVSFERLLEILGKHMNSNTILIGHGLENDLNAMRLIHEKVVDTAILYPKFKATPTFRYSLKDLTFTYLSRDIQGGEHDSREDSLAAIDLVKYFTGRELDMRRDA